MVVDCFQHTMRRDTGFPGISATPEERLSTMERRLRRSQMVTAPLLASAAVGVLAGCHQAPEMQRCVDEQNRVVDQKFCQSLPAAQGQRPGYAGGMGFYPYHFYYGGGGGWYPGTVVYGGSTSSMAGHSYTTSSSAAHSSSGTSRGGFGSSFGGGSSAHGGGAGE